MVNEAHKAQVQRTLAAKASCDTEDLPTMCVNDGERAPSTRREEVPHTMARTSADFTVPPTQHNQRMEHANNLTAGIHMGESRTPCANSHRRSALARMEGGVRKKSKKIDKYKQN